MLENIGKIAGVNMVAVIHAEAFDPNFAVTS